MSEEFVMQVVLDAIEELRANDWNGSGLYEILISALSILQIYKMKDDDGYIVDKSAALSAFSEELQVALIFNQKENEK